MQLSNVQVRRVADLARLNLTDDIVAGCIRRPPIAPGYSHTFQQVSADTQVILRIAGEQESGCFAVPKVIDQ